MVAVSAVGFARPLHPLHAILLAFPLPLFLGALLSDWAYADTYHVQWSNFASWLIAGGLAVGAGAVLWALVDLFRVAPARRKWHMIYAIVLVAMWVIGFINALVHARDAWATMPEGLYLSVITTLLAMIAAWMGYSRYRAGDTA